MQMHDDSKMKLSVGDMDRTTSLLLGGGLVLFGLLKRSFASLVLGVLGASIAYRGVTGRSLMDQIRRRGAGYDADGMPRGTVVPSSEGIKVDTSVTVNRPRQELYQFWHDFTNLPRIMRHLESVELTGERKSHWVAKMPVGLRVEWDGEIIDELPNQHIGWRSLANADIDHAGSIHFEDAPAGRGTEVRVRLQYRPPAGRLGHAFISLFGSDPLQMIQEDLRRFKQLMEAGEVVATAASQPVTEAPSHTP